MSLVLQGATSGSITLQEPAIAGNTVLSLPATSGTILTSASAISASSITTGTLPKAQLPTGSVLQVISTVDSTQRSTTSSSFVASGMSVTITPTSATSKIFIQVSSNAYKNFDPSGFFTIYRNSTNLATSANHLTLVSVPDRYVPMSMSYLDSPSSTSALTYEIYYRMSGTGNIYLNATTAGATFGTITVFEIAG